MTISSQTICFEARCKCGVGFIHTQLASSYANAPQQLASSRSTVGFITRDFHALISRQHSQTNRHGLYTLFLTSKSRCMQKISSVDALFTTQNVLSRSGRFGGGHTGWSQLQLASSVSPLWCIGCRAGMAVCALWHGDSPHKGPVMQQACPYDMDLLTALLADVHIDGLVQERRYSIADAQELCLSCTNPSVSNVRSGTWRSKGCWWHTKCHRLTSKFAEWPHIFLKDFMCFQYNTWF